MFVNVSLVTSSVRTVIIVHELVSVFMVICVMKRTFVVRRRHFCVDAA